MSIIEAREVLDLARQGEQISRRAITLALRATGDLSRFRQQQISKIEGRERALARYYRKKQM
jgi:hypothetical protein